MGFLTKHQKQNQPTLTQYRGMLEAAGDIVLALDLARGDVLRMDGGGLDETPRKVSECAAWALKNYTCPDAPEAFAKAFSPENLSTGEAWKAQEFLLRRLRPEAGGALWYRCVLRRSKRDSKTVYLTLRDVDELHRQETEMRRRADMDSLTQVYNRGNFEKEVSRRFAENDKKRRGFLMVDIDDFKALNDLYGHQAGDEALREMARQMTELFPAPSIVGRIGGDEFLILAEEVAEPETPSVWGERLTARFEQGAAKTRTTCSVGICLAPQDGKDFDTLYRHADLALYHAKTRGKNQYSFYTSTLLEKNSHKVLCAMRDQSELPFLQKTLFEENDFLEYIFAVLYENEDVEQALQSIMEFVVRYFSLDCAYFFSANKDGCLELHREWCRAGDISAVQGISCVELGAYTRKLLNAGLYYTNKITELPTALADAFVKSGATGVMLLPFQQKERLTGLLALEARTGRQSATKQETRALRIAAQVISANLQHRWDIEQSRRSAAVTRRVMDTMSNGIYVIDTETYRLLYYNEEVRRAHGGTIPDVSTCYEAFFKEKEPCDICPIKKLRLGEGKASASIYSHVLGTRLEVTASEILWEGGRRAYLLTGYDRQETALEKEQRRRDRRYRFALRGIYDFICEIDLQTGFYESFDQNEHMKELLPPKGFFCEELAVKAQQLLVTAEAQRLTSILTLENLRALKNERSKELRVEYYTREGHWHSARAVFTPGENGRPDTALLFIREISDQRQIDTLTAQNEFLQQQLAIKERLKQDDERYKIIVRQTGASVFEWNPPSRYVSAGILDAFDVVPDQDLLNQLGRPPLLYQEDAPTFQAFRKRLRDREPTVEVRCRFLTRSGQYRWYQMAVTIICDEANQVLRAVGSILDVDEQTKAFEALQYKAEFDTLTGIYNYGKFCQEASRFIKSVPHGRCAVLVLDVERFKLINDRFGLEMGDSALRYIARALEQTAGKLGKYARVQADEFCIVLPYLTKQDVIKEIRHLNSRLQRFREDCPIGARVGVYLVEDPDIPVNLMVDRARIAGERAKGNAVQPYAFYEKELRDRLLTEQKIEREAEAALEKGEFEVFLQPKYSLPQHRICGAEALVRWRHPEHGLIAPGEFLPLLERNGMILRLDQYVWEETAKILRRWREEKRAELPVSVNVSRLHISRVTLTPLLAALTEKYGLAPKQLHLELTETLLMENQEELVGLMEALRDAGFILELDDFGSGYSSLNILRDVPVDILKLDKGFLDETLTGPRGQIVIRHVLEMARELGLSVVAEGVETKEQMDFLRCADCDMIQGYFIARPLPVEDFEKLAFED